MNRERQLWWAAVTAAVLPMTLCGCTGRLRFVPQERISADNVDRLETVYRARLADYTWMNLQYLPLSLLIRERPSLICAAAVNSDRQVLYIQRQWGDPGRSSGFDTIDLNCGARVRHTRVPRYPDLSGTDPVATGDTHFDVKRGVAYNEGYLYSPPVAFGWRGTYEYADKFGESAHALLALDLRQDRPRVVAYNARLAPDPIADEHRLLIVLERQEFIDTHVAYVDRETGNLARELAIPDSDEKLQIVGGRGDYVLAVLNHRRPEKPVARCVLAPEGSAVKVIARRALEPETWPVAQVLDQDRGRWVCWETSHGKTWLRTYAVPSLELVGEHRSEWTYSGISLIPNSSIVAAVQLTSGRPAQLELFDLGSQAEIKRFALPPFEKDYDVWTIVTDADGKYVGACSTLGVQLFAVRLAASERANNR